MDIEPNFIELDLPLEQRVLDLIRDGLSPRKIELAYKHSIVSTLRNEFRVKNSVIRALARRWGIK